MEPYDHIPSLRHKIYLILQVEQHTAIWDSINDAINYKNQNAKRAAFNSIGRNMNVSFPGEHFSGNLQNFKEYCIKKSVVNYTFFFLLINFI